MSSLAEFSVRWASQIGITVAFVVLWLVFLFLAPDTFTRDPIYRSFAQTIATAMPPLPRHDFVLFLCRLIDNTELGDPESRGRFL